MLRALSIVLLSSLVLNVYAVDLTYYLPEDQSYDESVPTPQNAFGFEVGSKHLQHHQVVEYARRLAAASSRVKVTEYAQSHGQRPLIYLTITSPANHRRLEKIRTAHLQLADPTHSSPIDLEKMPAVIWMGYGVHGNEPSATNAAPLVAYHLAAARGESMEQLLENTIILLDPCLNPDGFERFAHWANNYRGAVANPDPQHREHRELSPTGRTNYYWFDLNRDWLPVQHPESRGRLAVYHEWLPNVVLDYHEMGGDSTYFFQPGVPSRMHPLTPASNLELTRRFAKYHAQTLDEIGALYYTEERFDDFYMGKGSTYPDLHGAVGILFEQASARGQKQTNSQGTLEFHFAIRNQVRTSLSSLAATFDTRIDLLKHQRDFYRDSVALARNAAEQGFVFSAGTDKARAQEFLDILHRHAIRVHRLATNVTLQGKRFKADEAFIIPVEQPEYRFLLAMTETRKTFKDKVFYDITAWSVPLAFGLDWASVEGPINPDWVGDQLDREEETSESSLSDGQADENAYAYLVRWSDLHAPRLLRQLLDENIKVRVAQRPFKALVNDREETFDYGTLVISPGVQPEKTETLRCLLSDAANHDQVRVASVLSGLTDEGIDLGSSSIAALQKPRVMLLVGVGIDDYEAGEIWHLLDQRLGMPVTLVDSHLLGTTNLNEYSTIVMVSGTYSQVSESGVERLTDWLKRDGCLIALGTSSRWLQTKKIATLRPRVDEAPSKSTTAPVRLPYAEADDRGALQKIEGTIFNTEIDGTHPLCYGIQRSTLPVFRDHAYFLEPSTNPFSTPAIYTPEPLLSGYASEENQRLAAGSAAVLVKSEGSGRVIAIPNNPNFRGFWFGSQRLFVNSLFFGRLVREP